jgi:predicted nuclease of predicted toxin-antitoxin system
MRVLANENFPGPAIEAPRAKGHDAVWVRTDMPGATDDAVLERAQAEERLVVTFDKDFGELAFRWGLPATRGVILFRISLPSSDAAIRRIVEVLENRTDWYGRFAVAEEHRTRLRPLPAPRRAG